MSRTEKPLFGDRQPFGERVLDMLSGSSIPASTIVHKDRWHDIRASIENLNIILVTQRGFNKLTASMTEQLPGAYNRVQAHYANERAPYLKTVLRTLHELCLDRYMELQLAMNAQDDRYHLVARPGYSVTVEEVEKDPKIIITKQSPEATKIQRLAGYPPPIM